MNFVWPYALIALPLALVGVLVLFKSSRRARERLLGHFAAPRLLPLLLASHSPMLRRIKQGLLTVGILLAVLALARPQWGYDWQIKESRGVDVVFVLDTSKSMLTQDVQPSRLERAKLAILDSVEKMGGNRVGLVAFAGDAFLLCPLTLDYDAFRQTLEAVDVNTIAQGGTNIGAGLDEAATALEKSGNHKIIVLLTDGEDLEGQGISEAQALAKQDVTIYAVGVGTPQGDIIPIRDANGGTDFVRDERGQIVKSQLDAATLTSIAEATHGFYQPLGPTGEGLTKVYEQGIKKIPEQNLTSQMERQPIERYQWPLAAGTLLLALEMLIGTRRPSWRKNNLVTVNLAEPLPVISTRRGPAKPASGRAPPVIATALLLSLLLGSATRTHAADDQIKDSPSANPPGQSSPPSDTSQSAPTPLPNSPASTTGPASAPAQQYSVKQAQDLYQKGDYLGAAAAYGQAADANPQDSRFRYDQGDSLYRGGNFDAAAGAFSKSLSSNDLQLQQRSYYNLGNTHYRLGQADQQQDPQKTQASWEQAVKDYQNALELNSKDADARYNLGVVKQQIEELKKQMEQQKQQQKQNQQNQNNQQQNQQNQSQNQPQNQSQQNQSQNQSGQQNNASQSQSQNGQSQPQGQSGQQSSSSANNNQSQQNSSGSQGQNKQQSGQNQPQNQNNPQNSPGSQNQPKPGQNGQQNQPGQKPGDQNQNAPQPQPASQAGTNPSGKEPSKQNAGQSQAAGAAGTGGAAGSAAGSASNADQAANGTVVAGGMTREEARQLLDSLKSNEQKLPASNLQNPNAKPPADQYQKDW